MSPVRSAPFVPLVALALGLAGASGCAAARAGLQVQDAIAAREQAREAGAEQDALYEYTMANRYLEKAWEEMGTGQYKMSVSLSKKSAAWSDQAVVQVERGARAVEVDLATLRDGDVVPHPEQPAPAPAAGTPPATPTPTGPIVPDDAPMPPAEPAAPAPAAPAAPEVP
ncbi:MAG: hypothetical protein R3F61_27700 [Myxococcota bacterium]